ncbi:NAD-dependent epimerase/dehydratase family protein [Terrisporobacter petrolearius]|uniref:NAD-dependent epimerase/dehydratase family protein n=1 Tax=Terrisporobacter petrolearius TaxID=1460447 RepID=UPI0022E75911|nr:NAD-dependent epimerase/dehydratase family protein [Terrisporobacter petrolearius]
MDYKIKSNVNEFVYNDAYEITQAKIPWESFNNNTILITGAGGFIGYYLTLSLLLRNDLHNQNIKVVGMVRNEKNASAKYGKLLDRDDFKLVIQDVCNKFVINEEVNYIVHAASNASAWHFENKPVETINANLIGTMNVLEFARKNNDCKVLFISSLKVYGSVHDGSKTLKEDNIGYLDHTSYKNCYAQGKRAAETLCATYNKEYGLDIKIARPSYIYGASKLDDDRVWAQFFANVVRRQNILLKSNGATMRSFCYVTDTVSALLTILLKGENIRPYNISSEENNITIRDFAKMSVNVFPKRKLSLSFANKSDEIEPMQSYFSATPEILNNNRLMSIGWIPKVNLKEGVIRSINTIEEQNKDVLLMEGK